MAGVSHNTPPTPEQIAILGAAVKRAARVRRAAKVTTFNGWTTGFFAFVTLIGGLFGLPALLLGIAMAIVTINEFRGGAMLRRFDPRAPRLLGWNQLLLLGAIVGYCLWNLFGAQPVLSQTSGDPSVDELLADFEGLETTIRVAVYGTVILVTTLAQGLNSLYYFTRAKYIAAYLDATPLWAIEVQQAAA
jgi:hypothetical protein